MMMDTNARQDPFVDLTQKLAPIFDWYHIEKAIVFGTFARGEITRHSDIDLILIKKTQKRFLDRFEGIDYEINRVVKHHGVDLLIYTPAEFRRISHRKFIQRVLHEGKVIYERPEKPA